MSGEDFRLKKGFKDLPKDFLDILSEIEELDKQVFRPNPDDVGKELSVERTIKGSLLSSKGNLNVIPGTQKDSICKDYLLVKIDFHRSPRNLIDKAVKHISEDCPQTKGVIFYATKWDTKEWFEKKTSFKRIPVILKLANIELIWLNPDEMLH